ncbi:MAG: hypothetical protein H6772_03145 [Pseudomonadales bacterium]|nr:hypothetical protein [Pseudomonadales bacterium]
MIRFKVTPVVGLPQFTGWSQVAESTSSVNTRLICVFAISGKHAGNVGRDVSDKISDFYFYDIEQLHEFVNDLIEFVQDNDCKIYLSSALINGDKSIFVTYGGSVFLKRKEKVGKILFSKDEIKIVKGSYTENDVFVLTTYQASQFLNEIEQKFIKGFDVDIIITSVVPGLHAQADSSLSAIVFINQAKSLEKISDNENWEKEPSIQASIDFDDQDEGLQANENNSFIIEKENDIKLLSSDYLFKIIMIIKGLINYLVILIKYLPNLIKKINLSKIKVFFKSLKKIRLKDLFNGKISLRDDSGRNKSLFKFLIIGLIFIVFLTTIVIFTNGRRKDKERIQNLLIPIEERILIAKQNINDDPISSRDITLGVINSLEKLKAENLKSSSVSLIDNKLAETTTFYDEISGKVELDELPIFYDLRLVRSDYIASNLDVSNEKISILDSEKKQVVVLDALTKKVSVRDFAKFEQVKDLSINANTVYVLTDGIKSFDLEEGSEIKEVKVLGDSNRNALYIDAYDRFVYVFSPDKRNIYRYSKESEGYSDPVGWMKSETGLKYDEVLSMAIDGDIWLTNSSGQIKKFASGKEESFEIRGLSNQFLNGIKIYTNDDLDNLYILDANNKRIVILSKSGDFIREIKSVSLATVSSIAVSKSSNKIYAVSGSIIFEIDANE